MKKKTIIIKDPSHLREAAREFIEDFHDILIPSPTSRGGVSPGTGRGSCFAFYAPMGAGKTTFIKAICEELGSEDVITSPTFAIVNEYGVGGAEVQGSRFKVSSIFHFDLYRIKKAEELYDIGAEDYFYSGSPCFIEWPEMAEGALPDDTIKITITPQPDGSRVVEY